MSFSGVFRGKRRGRIAIPTNYRTARALAVAVESLERRYLLSTALGGPASWTAYTPLVVVNASGTLSAPFTAPEIRTAYGLTQVSDEGSGQTIAIVDAYNDPDIVTDANTFSGTYGLQKFNTRGGPTLTVENEFGSTSNLPANSQLNAPDGQQWDVEESLD
ncbi:MAG: LEPR-XLL domain-containing protein, partial [Tepidisphaeraceae bacterium]